MKITRRQIRRIIAEIAASGHRAPTRISPEQVESYLISKADEYRRQGLKGGEVKMLLQDDFMDDLGHQHDVRDYETLIDELTELN